MVIQAEIIPLIFPEINKNVDIKTSSKTISWMRVSLRKWEAVTVIYIGALVVY